MVGPLPLCATAVMEARIPKAIASMTERLRRMPELSATIRPVRDTLASPNAARARCEAKKVPAELWLGRHDW